MPAAMLKDAIPETPCCPAWQRWGGRLLWTAVIGWTLWIARWLFLFLGYALTGDYDPTAVIQLGHLSLFTLMWPLIMLFRQRDEILVLLFLVIALVIFKLTIRRLPAAREPG